MEGKKEWVRNLNESQLGGVVFGCTDITMGECLSSQLFGLPSKHFLYVQNIKPGLPLFLFSYSNRKLHGIYEAASSGKRNIDPYAWTREGMNRTEYPAQVQFCVRLKCQAISEDQFKPIIADNYYTRSHFRFELDHAQVTKLISIFSSLPGPRSLIPKNPKEFKVAVKSSPSNDNVEEIGPSEPSYLTGDVAIVDDSVGTSDDLDDSQSFYRYQLKEASPRNQKSQMLQPDEKDHMYMKLEKPAFSPADSDVNIMEAAAADAFDLVLETDGNDSITWGKGKDESSYDSFEYPAFISKLRGEMEELKAFKQEHPLKLASLEKNLMGAKQQIDQLQNRCMILESLSNPSVTLAGDKSGIELPDIDMNLDQSICLVGGYDGASWSSELEFFSPSHDVLKSLKPMSSVRANASVAKLGGELYVVGGASSSMWFDTVESYNAVNNHWTLLPSLNQKRGCLGAAVLDGKLFAVGGGNDLECFLGVEMFDPNIGRWISSRSMKQKRFSLAVVECCGVIYAVGGFDGNKYLKSAERYDIREHSWRRISDMQTTRASHSLVVLNEKLYAIGGYDGAEHVPSVEMYDPRLGKWITVEAMNQGRGYSAAALLDESIFVIGGIKSGRNISDSIECYKEGRGWEATNLRAVGKRCFASAIVLGKD